MAKKGATYSKSSAGIQRAKDSAMAARMKSQGIVRPGSDATLPALEARMRLAWPPTSSFSKAIKKKGKK